MQLGQVRARRVLVLLGDRDVDAAAGEQRQRLLGLELGQLDAQRRVRGGQPPERRHHERARRGLERRDAHDAAHLARPARGEVGLELARARPARRRRAPRACGRRRSARAAARVLRNSSTPASRWSCASCCETADGVNASASAAPAIVPWATNSRSTTRRRGASIVEDSLNFSVQKQSLVLKRWHRHDDPHARLPQLPRRRCRRPGRPRARHVRRPAHLARRGPARRHLGRRGLGHRQPRLGHDVGARRGGAAGRLRDRVRHAQARRRGLPRGARRAGAAGGVARRAARRRRARRRTRPPPPSRSAAACSATSSTSRPGCSGPRSSRSSSRPRAARCSRSRW